MRSFKKIWCALCLLSYALPAISQTRLSPGFDPAQYRELLEITNAQNKGLFPEPGKEVPPGTGRVFTIPEPKSFHLSYRSPDMGLFNQWDLWVNGDSSLAVISIRGTIMKTESWMENFYAAMVPATGSLKVNDSTTFSYKLARDSEAAVHVGWLLGLAYLAPSILTQVQRLARSGTGQFIIFGHSQGGALAFLLRSYLYYLPDSVLPQGLVFKTYCSAAPKPGNLYYAYDFDYLTRGGWGYRVVNARDWVPETPFSLQTLDDFNQVNPFVNLKPALKNTNLLVRLYANHVFKKMDRSSKKANKRFRKILGKTIFKQIHKTLPQFREPRYVQTMNYTQAGTPVILMPYPSYDTDFPFDGKNVFIHHGLGPYYELTLHQNTH